MDFVNRQVFWQEFRGRIVKSVYRQTRAADDFLYADDFSGRQNIIGHRQVLIEALGVTNKIAKPPFLCRSIEAGFGVGKTNARQVYYSIGIIEMVEQRVEPS
jgi:hypothetical protein